MPSLTFSFQYLPGVTVIAVAGEMDITNAYLLDDYISRIRRHPGDHIVLDLSEVPFMSGSALHVLLHTHLVARRNGAGLHVAAVQRAPAHLLHVTGIEDTFNIHHSVEQAIRAALEASQPSLVGGDRGAA
ncbi:STAS domain-containing protein [Nonomuraea sp. NPDC049504]|uniref:STAS domain-containing protein n=1 Tax=Nonomuraea sp. NPDC049504 TaxID=3154729 RepID=UPI00342A0786